MGVGIGETGRVETSEETDSSLGIDCSEYVDPKSVTKRLRQFLIEFCVNGENY